MKEEVVNCKRLYGRRYSSEFLEGIYLPYFTSQWKVSSFSNCIVKKMFHVFL